ncbi:MAG TPA: hypothetical protein VNA20_15140 [Frankiaceae bacterium]|nr:hypothetical protein [Frankiaceae bacterium]
MLKPSALLHAEPPPRALHAEPAVALGIAAFSGLLASDPPSPLLNFKATDRSLWALNPDGSLYCRVDWSEVTVVDLDEQHGVWHLRGAFFNSDFALLRLEPTRVYREPLRALLVEQLELPRTAKQPPSQPPQ